MATAPNFASTPKTGIAQVSAANTARDGTGTIVSVFSAGASGSIVYKIKIVAVGTSTSNVIRLFLNDGTNTRLFEEVMVPAITPSATNHVFAYEITFPTNAPLFLPTNYSLRASTNNAETYNIFAFGADL
jgi:hypothetical protein